MVRKQKMLADIKQTRKKLGESYESLKRSSKEAWQVTKDTFLKGYHELEHQFRIENEYEDDGLMNRVSADPK